MARLVTSATITACLAICIMGATTQTVHAVTPTTNNSGEALEIDPPVITLSANPGQTLQTQISLRDISSGELLVTNQVNDFTAAGLDGTPKILTDSIGNNPYSLISWVTPIQNLDLKPHQIKSLPITIHVPANAAPGGYYGTVRFTATPPPIKGQGVSLSASIGSLLLIKVNGQAKEQLSISSFTANPTDITKKTPVVPQSKTGLPMPKEEAPTSTSLFEATPVYFAEQIKNEGNVFEQPAGQVIITDMFGKTIAAVNVNLPPRNILPQTTRQFSQVLDSSELGSRILFGQYHAQLKMVYGDSKQVVTSSLSFWVIPYKLIIAAIIAILILFFGLRFSIKRYNQHIISRAQKK